MINGDICFSEMEHQVMQHPKRILAIKLRELGDTAIWTSALDGLNRLFPKAELHVLVNPSSEALLIRQPYIHNVHKVSSTNSLALIPKLIQLRKYRFDLALGFHATTSLCRWIPWLGAKKVGLHHHSWPFTPKHSDLVLEKPGVLQGAIARDYELLKSLGWTGPELSTHLNLLDSEKNEAKQLLENSNIDFQSSHRLLALLPGARSVTRRYPRDRWIEMVQMIKSRCDYQLIVVTDKSLSEEWNLTALCRELNLPLFDQLDLRQFMALLSFASQAITNDSGPLHIAAALGVSTLALFGPGCVGDWHPYENPNHQVLRVPIDCRSEGPAAFEAFRYCTVTQCDHLSCLRLIEPKNIIERLSHNTEK